MRKWNRISSGHRVTNRVRIRVEVNVRVINFKHGYKEVSHNYYVLGVMKIGP